MYRCYVAYRGIFAPHIKMPKTIQSGPSQQHYRSRAKKCTSASINRGEYQRPRVILYKLTLLLFIIFSKTLVRDSSAVRRFFVFFFLEPWDRAVVPRLQQKHMHAKCELFVHMQFSIIQYLFIYLLTASHNIHSFLARVPVLAGPGQLRIVYMH